MYILWHLNALGSPPVTAIYIIKIHVLSLRNKESFIEEVVLSNSLLQPSLSVSIFPPCDNVVSPIGYYRKMIEIAYAFQKNLSFTIYE